MTSVDYDVDFLVVYCIYVGDRVRYVGPLPTSGFPPLQAPQRYLLSLVLSFIYLFILENFQNFISKSKEIYKYIYFLLLLFFIPH